MNIHLNYDSNEIIQVIGDMTAEAKVAVSINADSTIYEKHGKEGKPFATIANGVNVDPSSFINDRDTSLSATISETNPNLLVWSYPLIADVLDDYYIDGSVAATTKLLENKYFVDASFNGGTADFLTAFFHQHPVDFNKISNFARVSVLAHKAVDGVTYPTVENVTNLRFVVSGDFGGKRWEISTDNGVNWSPLMGRRVQIHYNRECRENVKFKLTTDGTTAIPSATFKLERSYPGSSSYSLYTAGSGKGKTTSGGAEVKDSSVNGIYTTDNTGSFMMNLPEGYYRLTETTSKTNYKKLSNPITFHVTVNQVKDIAANAQVSPYQVDGVSNATWTMNDYATWNTDRYIGTLRAENPDAYPPVTIDVHIMQLNANGTLTNKDSEWRTVNHTIQLSGAISEANLREAAKNCIRDDARFEVYGTTYKVKENASSYYLYGVSDGATVDITSSLNVSGEDILIDNDDTKSLASRDVYLVVARGLRLEGYKTDNGTDWTFIPGSRGEYWEDYFPQGMNEGKSLVKQNQYNLGEVATAYEQKLNFNHDGYLYAYAVLASDTSIVLDSVKTVATDMGWDSSLNANVKSYKWQYKVVGGNDFVDLGADDYVMMRYNPFPIKVPIYWVFVDGDALTVIPAADFNWYGTSLDNVPHEAEVYDTNPYVLAKYGSGLSENHWVMPYLGMDQTTDTETYPYQMYNDDGVTPDGTWHAKYKFSYFAVDEPLISNTGSLTRKYADTNAMYLQACNDGVQFANNASLQDAHTSFTCGLYVVYEGMPESNYICKIGTERFKTLRAAVKYATDNNLTNAIIEMLVDYTMPADDTVTIPTGYDITLTTASKTGDAGYTYTGSGDTATITRDFTPTEETDTRDKLFTVTGYQAKLTFTNITIDGDKANHTGYKGSLVYVNGDSSNSGTNVPAVVIGSGATLQNAKTSKDGGGAVFVDHGTVTVDVGGTIKDCEAVNGDGGAIFVQSSGGVVNISGSLSGNGAKNGGAIKTGKNVVVNINSTAVIKNNDASENGGAIYTSGSVNMTGGSIENNTAANKGAGIYADSDGSISFSGSPVVYDNKVDGKQRNVEYSGNGNGSSNTTINLTSPLGDSAKIGVYAPGGHNNTGDPFGTRNGVTANLYKLINDQHPELYAVKVDGDDLLYWSYFVARVSKDNGATWTYHEYLISDETDTQNGQTIRKGAFNQANSLTGSVIIETLLETHERYTIPTGFTFNETGLTSLEIRTTNGLTDDQGEAVRSTLKNGQSTASMLTFNIPGNLIPEVTVKNLILDGNGQSFSGEGGAINTDNKLTLDNAEITGFTANKGAAVYVNGASLTVKDSRITGNTATVGSGAIDSKLATSDLTFNGNAYVYGNKDSAGKAANVFLAHDVDTAIKTTGLGEESMIGVRVKDGLTFTNRGEEGKWFGTFSGSNTENYLGHFYNDVRGYYGVKAAADKIKWQSIPVPRVPIYVEKVWGSTVPDSAKQDISFSIEGTSGADRYPVNAYASADLEDTTIVDKITAADGWKKLVYVPEYALDGSGNEIIFVENGEVDDHGNTITPPVYHYVIHENTTLPVQDEWNWEKQEELIPGKFTPGTYTAGTTEQITQQTYESYPYTYYLVFNPEPEYQGIWQHFPTLYGIKLTYKNRFTGIQYTLEFDTDHIKTDGTGKYYINFKSSVPYPAAHNVTYLGIDNTGLGTYRTDLAKKSSINLISRKQLDQLNVYSFVNSTLKFPIIKEYTQDYTSEEAVSEPPTLRMTNLAVYPELIPVVVQKVWDPRINWSDAGYKAWKDLNSTIPLTVDGKDKKLNSTDKLHMYSLGSTFTDFSEKNPTNPDPDFTDVYYVGKNFTTASLTEGELVTKTDAAQQYLWTKTVESPDLKKWVDLTGKGQTQKGYIHLHSHTTGNDELTRANSLYTGVNKIVFEYQDGLNTGITYQSVALLDNAKINEEGKDYYVEVLLPANADVNKLTIPWSFDVGSQDSEKRFGILVFQNNNDTVSGAPCHVQGRARVESGDELRIRYDNVSFSLTVPAGGKEVALNTQTHRISINSDRIRYI